MIKILVIDNDEEIRSGIVELFMSDSANQYQLLESDFTDFKSKIAEADLVITDYNHDKVDPSAGLNVFNQIRNSKFAPILIYSGFVHSIDNSITSKSNATPFIKIIEKSATSADALKSQVDSLVNSKEFKVKKAVENDLADAVRNNFREYYWNYIDQFGTDFVNLDLEVLKRILTRKVIKDVHPSLSEGVKIHPIEFYEHPVSSVAKIETGSVLKKDNDYFVCINNDCDIEVRSDGTCNAKRIYLLKVYDVDPSWYKNDEEYSKLINNNSSKSNSRFILPKTFFFSGGYVDFSEILSFNLSIHAGKIKLDEVGEIVAKIHPPFIQRLISNFARYYSRFGTPDIDVTGCTS